MRSRDPDLVDPRTHALRTLAALLVRHGPLPPGPEPAAPRALAAADAPAAPAPKATAARKAA